MEKIQLHHQQQPIANQAVHQQAAVTLPVETHMDMAAVVGLTKQRVTAVVPILKLTAAPTVQVVMAVITLQTPQSPPVVQAAAAVAAVVAAQVVQHQRMEQAETVLTQVHTQSLIAAQKIVALQITLLEIMVQMGPKAEKVQTL